jgi:hypothetical protein
MTASHDDGVVRIFTKMAVFCHSDNVSSLPGWFQINTLDTLGNINSVCLVVI